MKLSEIEAHAYLKKAVEPKITPVFLKPEYIDIEFIDYPVYTAEQIQDYAKAKVKELLFEQLWNDRFYANSKIFFDKEVEKICSSIFEEDTKND